MDTTSFQTSIDHVFLHHSMAMGNLNKTKETTQTATTALKVEDHYPLESKSLLLDQNLLT